VHSLSWGLLSGAYWLGAYRLGQPISNLEVHSLSWALQSGGLQVGGLQVRATNLGSGFA
jgi:hypothetical protein